MSLDTITLQAVVDECNAWAGARIVGIDQTGPHEIALTLKGVEGRRALAVSVQPDFARLFLMQPPKRSNGASALLNAMRTRLLGGVLERVETVSNERIAVIRCAGPTPEGLRRYRLIVEMIGRQTMIAFTHEEELTIIETLRRVRTGGREPMPGRPYEPPENPGKTPLSEVVKDDLAGVVDTTAPDRLIREMVRRIGGLSPVIASEIVAGASLSDPDVYGQTPRTERLERLWSEVRVLRTRISMKAWEPTLGRNEQGTPVVLAPIPIVSLPAERTERCASMSAAIDRFYTARLEQVQRRQREQQVRRALGDEEARLKRLVENLERDRAVTEQEDTFRRFGELLTAHIHLLRPGQSWAEVPDFYAPDRAVVRIPLDPASGPAENAQRYFKRARKARNGRHWIEQRLMQTRTRQEEVQTHKAALEQATDEYAVERAYRACVRLGLIKEKKETGAPNRKRQKTPEIHPRRFVASDGSIVLVGRNPKENEILTKTASPDDLWLHARDMGGSHVILKREGRKAMPSKKTCYEAACVAAYFSKGRGSATVPVDYTERRYVRKMKDGAPGQVVFTHEKTLFVEPKLLPEADG